MPYFTLGSKPVRFLRPEQQSTSDFTLIHTLAMLERQEPEILMFINDALTRLQQSTSEITLIHTIATLERQELTKKAETNFDQKGHEVNE